MQHSLQYTFAEQGAAFARRLAHKLHRRREVAVEEAHVVEIEISARHRTDIKALLSKLQSEKIPFAIGGAFALNHYTGIWRDTKDMDVFILPDDVDRILELGREAGFNTWMQDRHWLAKGRKDGYLVDFIAVKAAEKFVLYQITRQVK
jgi:hypothetical protein